MNKRQYAKKASRSPRKTKFKLVTGEAQMPIAEPRKLTGIEANTAMLASITGASRDGQIIVGVGNLITYLRLKQVPNAAIVDAFRQVADLIEKGKI